MKRLVPTTNNITFSTITTTNSTVRKQFPNRFTNYFQLMKDEKDGCPDAIRAYANCVQRANNNEDAEEENGGGGSSSGLVQGSCQKEFDLVKECFSTVRKRVAQAPS